MPKKCQPFSPNLVRHLFEKDASCPGIGQAAILDLQDQLRGPPSFECELEFEMEHHVHTLMDIPATNVVISCEYHTVTC